MPINMIAYRFRAECMKDVADYLSALIGNNTRINHVKIDLTVSNGVTYPDCEVTLLADVPLSVMTAVAEATHDCHVIEETIQPTSNYTGNRE